MVPKRDLLSPKAYITVLYLLLINFKSSYASIGDRSQPYNKCINRCFSENCSGHQTSWLYWPDSVHEVFVWDCESECKYQCMWETVAAFQHYNVPVPQFHGKWPFIRLLGIQEPASTLFSILNAAAHLYSIRLFRRSVIPRAPMYYIWHVYCIVALNTWFWSTIFHIRDLSFTEKMDYFCATALVTFQLFGLIARAFIFKGKQYIGFLGILVAGIFLWHVYRMAFIHFDYGYHVKVNVALGLINATGWFLWCMYSRRGRPYVWKSYTSILFAGAFLALEVLDFPPLFWIFDAHSLWHAGTAPLTLLWYSFIIDDCNHMVKYGNEPSTDVDKNRILHLD